MITLVGVGHVFDIKAQIRSIILAKRPDIVAVELDHARLAALMDPGRQGRGPLTIRLAAHFQKRLAGEFGTSAGSEMLAAVQTARESGAAVSLIDMDMTRVFAEIRATISFEEKVRILFAAFASFFVRKKTVEREIRNFQEHEDMYMEELGKSFPNLKIVLIDRRNEFMAGNLRKISERYRNILAVVGDGHVPGMSKLLADMSPEVIRLKDVREWDIEKPPVDEVGRGDSGSSFSYSFEMGQ